MITRILLLFAICFSQFNIGYSNDNVCNATSVALGPIGVSQTFSTATVQIGEDAIAPPGDSCDDHSWCEGTIHASLWFTFTAPASGNVNISLCNSTFDTQLAIYAVGNCNDFNTFDLLDANDDSPNGTPGSECGPIDPNLPGYGRSSAIDLACLTPGLTYYVMVDEFSADGTINGGTIDLVITERASYIPVAINGINILNSACPNLNTGIAQVDIIGDYPVQILWSNGATTPTVTGVAAGTVLTVTVSNNCGNSDNGAITMTTQAQGAPLSVQSTISTQTNCGQGYAAIFATDGSPPYTYSWSNGATSQLTYLPAGPYQVTVEDGCANTIVSTVQVSAGVNAGADTTINGGSVTLGGTPTADIPTGSSITYNPDQALEENIACRGGGFISDNEFYHAYDLATDFGITSTFNLSEIEIGIFSATAGGGTGAQDLEARLYYINNLDLSVATLTFISSATITIPDVTVPLHWRIPLSASIPANQLFAIGIWNPDGTTFENTLALATNQTPLTIRETYISSVGCGITSPTPMSSIGFSHQTVINLVQNSATTNNYTYSWSPTQDLNDPTVANPVCTPSQIGATMYTVTVTDTQGCMISDDVVVNNSSGCTGLTTIIPTNSICNQADGSADLNVSGGVPPFSYLWSTGATTEDISNLSPGNYAVTVTGSTGCTYLNQVTIGSVNGQIAIYATATPTGCDLNTGTATASAPLATSPTYTWNTGQTGATINNLNQGWYSVTVVDNATGCFNHTNVFVSSSTSCKVRIEGNYWNDDINFDCIFDSTTKPLANRIIVLQQGGTVVDMTFTDSTGFYSFVADTGTYDLVLGTQVSDSLICPTNNVITVAAPFQGLVYEENFYAVYNEINDLSVYIITNPVRPGFTTNYFVRYCNDGTDPASGTVELVHDPLMTNFTSVVNPPASYDVITSTAVWNYNNLLPGECRTIPIVLTTPTGTALGTIISHTATVNPIPGDFTPLNNTITSNQTVTGSYDPNDKQNLVGEDPLGGTVHPDITTYHYLIRFQNTGTDTAFTVVVTDTIHPSFDLTSIRIVGASHNYTADIDQGNLLTFEFLDIMLVDSNANEPLSHGFVYFTIDLNPGVPIGSEIWNTANIYFDFNDPIITNTVENTVEFPAFIPKDKKQIFGLKLYPNPTAQDIMVELDMKESATVSLQLFDMSGRLVKSLKQNERMLDGSYNIPIRTSDLGPGVYMLNLSSDKGQITRRIVKL